MSRLVARAESFERVYDAFNTINFAAFDYDTIKQSLLDYVKLHFPETFNDFIESSEFIAIVETFAYIAELMAYRIDISAHENFISTAQRKDSILRLAKLVSYTAARPLPARGLVKITSVSTTESIIDANGIDLAGRKITWNDVSNSSWKDQFILVMNRAMEQSFGTVGPTDRFQMQDVLFELYSWNLAPLPTGVFSYSALASGTTATMELVPVEYNEQIGIVERRPQINTNFTFLYGQDGMGDASATTGFFCFTKQGNLQRLRATFDGVTPNQTYDVSATTVNDTDVWLNNVDPATGEVLSLKSSLPYRSETLEGKSGEWVQVDLAHAQNVIFNTNPKRSKYEVETLDKSKIRLIFGDGEFADVPSGTFDIWVRSSLDQDIVISQSAITNKVASFTYVDAFSRTQTFTFTFSLTSSLQNASAAEDIEHVRSTAPAVYYAQDRMVNGEDYNSYMLQDPSILKLRAINRTFAGDSKYIDWHDATGTYENVKIFGNDGIIYYEDKSISDTTPIVNLSQLLTLYLEPILSSTDMYTQLASINTEPAIDLSVYRRTFNDDEETRIAAALTAPPPEMTALLYYRFNRSDYVPVTNEVKPEWYAIKESAVPPTTSPTFAADMELLLPGWINGDYVTVPLITIKQLTYPDSKYTITRQASHIVFESQTTAFWNTNEANRVIEYDTLDSNRDNIIILQANTNSTRDGILDGDWTLDVLGQEINDTGVDIALPDIHRLSTLPADENLDGVPDNMPLVGLIHPTYTVDSATTVNLPFYYISGIGDVEYPTSMVTEEQIYTVTNTVTTTGATTFRVKEYVYFNRELPNDPWVPAPATPNTLSAYITDLIAGTQLWKRHEGKSGLNFAWFHRSSFYHLIDPSPTNIIDMFIITKGYHTGVKRWLENTQFTQPQAPTPLDLRTSYDYMLDNRMISDTVVLHPGRIKILFGPKAPQTLQAKIKIIRSQNTTLTDNQIKTKAVSAIRNFFDITYWEFGETFYFSELSAMIHAIMPTDISSAVLVPSFTQNQFGDLYQIKAREDEVFFPDITVDDIEIVTGYTSTNLRFTPS